MKHMHKFNLGVFVALNKKEGSPLFDSASSVILFNELV